MGKLIVISGPSGVGKGTIVNILKDIYQKKEDKLYISVSCTTRLPREGEIDGVNYYFISQDEFNRRIDENDFFEYNIYGTGKYYGTPKSTVLKYLNDGYDVILEIDINGYRKIKKEYPKCLGIFIMANDEEELYERLKKRGTEDEELIKVRLETAKEEIKNKDIYDYIVINQDGMATEAAMYIYDIIKNDETK